MTSPVTRLLDQAGIRYSLHVHQRPVRSLEQAAAERSLAPDQIVRSLLFRLDSEAYVLVLAAGPKQVSWPALRRALGVTRLTTATPEEVVQVTGYHPGTVSPLGLRRSVRILADRRLLRQNRVSIGAGIPNAGVELPTADLIRLTGAELVDLD